LGCGYIFTAPGGPTREYGSSRDHVPPSTASCEDCGGYGLQACIHKPAGNTNSIASSCPSYSKELSGPTRCERPRFNTRTSYKAWIYVSILLVVLSYDLSIYEVRSAATFTYRLRALGDKDHFMDRLGKMHSKSTPTKLTPNDPAVGKHLRLCTLV
jgi:hypothetical protein